MILDIHKFQKSQKIKFKNNSLLIEALTHKSANKKFNNEKLEFLGDRVIGLILSKKLIDLYPDENEGVLDKRFAALVNRKICCEIGWSIGIHNCIIIGNKKRKVTKKKVTKRKVIKRKVVRKKTRKMKGGSPTEAILIFRSGLNRPLRHFEYSLKFSGHQSQLDTPLGGTKGLSHQSTRISATEIPRLHASTFTPYPMSERCVHDGNP